MVETEPRHLPSSPAAGRRPGQVPDRWHSCCFNLEHFEEEWDRLKAKRVPLVSLLIIRIEGTRPGHADDYVSATQRLLRAAAVFEACLRKDDFLARLSDTEFGLLLPRADARGAVLVCTRLEGAAARFNRENELGLRFHFGIGSGSVAQGTFSKLLEEASASIRPVRL